LIDEIASTMTYYWGWYEWHDGRAGSTGDTELGIPNT